MPHSVPSHNSFLLINRVIASLRLRDYAEAEQSDFFGFGIHPDDLLGRSIRPVARPAPDKSCVGALRRAAPPAGARQHDRPERETPASPTGGIAGRQTGSDERRSSQRLRASAKPWRRSSGQPWAPSRL